MLISFEQNRVSDVLTVYSSASIDGALNQQHLSTYRIRLEIVILYYLVACSWLF